ncbi:hypothetical protein SAY86_006362 [Trapa natans]|uniref:Cathepsin propeptide inhibitor domain-containing protein n=1 Tax=Trapa natans TaxID=22666 RepID=A0AAN7QT92_TRANT|nr:hypothetical protein SAY86_006362 [Trapa natans]
MGLYKSVALLLTLLAVSSALDQSIISYDRSHGLQSEAEVRAIYDSWLARHGKAYNALGEKDRRFEIFKDNLRFIDEHNALNLTYRLGLNRFADLTNDEYRSTYLGAKRGDTRKRLHGKRVNDRYAPKVGDELPAAVDWRKDGAVAEVKDQGNCEECKGCHNR